MRDRGDAADRARFESRQTSRVANVVAETLSPIPVVSVMLLLVCLVSSSSWVVGLGWWLLSALFCAVLPLLFLLAWVRWGGVDDRHLVRRSQRLKPMLSALVVVFVGVAVLIRVGAPSEVSASVIAMLAGLSAITLVTTVWKASIHLAVSAGAVAVLYLILGGGALWLTPVLVIGGWARVRAGRHSVAQAIAGAVIGAAVGYVVYGAALPYV